MTQPTTPEEKAAAEKAAAEAAAAEGKAQSKARRGQVVAYTFADRVTGRDLEGLGVVLGTDGGQVVVKPLSNEVLYVDPENVAVASAGEVAPG